MSENERNLPKTIPKRLKLTCNISQQMIFLLNTSS